MGYFEITALTGAIFNAALAVMVMRGKVRSELHLAHLGWGIGLTIWNVATVVVPFQKTPEGALLWVKILHLGILFLPICMLHVCLKITHSRPTRWIPFLYFVHACLALTLHGRLYVEGVRMTPYGYWSVAGPLFHVYGVLYTVETSWFMVLLWSQRRAAPSTQKAGVTALMVGLFILVTCGANDMLPIIGVMEYPFIHAPFLPLANLAANLYAIMLAYAVLQDELMDIHITMSKAAAQVVRVGFVFMIALMILFVTWIVAPHAFTAFYFAAALATVVISTTTASVLFPRLFGSGGDRLERRILGDKFEYDARIRAFIVSAQESSDADQILKGLHEILVNVVRVSGYQVMMMEDARHKLSVLREHPRQTAAHTPANGPDSPLLQYFRTTGNEYLATALPSENPFAKESESPARRSLAESGAELCFPFTVSAEPFGLLLLNERTEGRRYTATDITLLTTLARNLSLALNNIRLRHQVIQESELLGRMSRGMAHDMNNLLTPMRAILQLMAEGTPVEALREALLPLASRNLETVSEYIQSSLFYSEHACCDFQPGAIRDVVEAAAATLREHCEREGIKITLQTFTAAALEMDKSFIQRAIFNVLSNAVDASGRGSEIRVEVMMLDKTGAEQDRIRIQVIDQGEGISPEHLQKLFTPFFTTKNRGDARRGSGLGLAICGKVVQMHGGTVDITSQPGNGTIVSIDLPIRQKSAASLHLMKPLLQPAADQAEPDGAQVCSTKQSPRSHGHDSRNGLFAAQPAGFDPPA